jgi:hypothetical protein
MASHTWTLVEYLKNGIGRLGSIKIKKHRRKGKDMETYTRSKNLTSSQLTYE